MDSQVRTRSLQVVQRLADQPRATGVGERYEDIRPLYRRQDQRYLTLNCSAVSKFYNSSVSAIMSSQAEKNLNVRSLPCGWGGVFLLHRLQHLFPVFFHLSLLFSDQRIDFLVDNISSGRVDNSLPFVHYLPLDLQHDWVIPDNRPYNIVSGFGCVVIADHLGALVEDRFKKFTGQFVLAILTVLGGNLAPHVGDEDDVLQCRVAAKLTKHPEIPSGHSGELFVGDPVDVDNSGKLTPSLVPIKRFSLEDREMADADVRLRRG